jgi:hypothetical protein
MAHLAMLATQGKLPAKRELNEMRWVKNFHPGWGYIAAANSFNHTIPIVLVATAVGATAAGGVVLSLVDVSASPTSVASYTVASPVQAPISAPEAAQLKQQATVKSESTMASGTSGHLGASEFSTNPKAEHDDAPVKVATAPSAAAAAPVENKAPKQHHVATNAPRVGQFGLVLGEHYANRTWGGPWR